MAEETGHNKGQAADNGEICMELSYWWRVKKCLFGSSLDSVEGLCPAVGTQLGVRRQEAQCNETMSQSVGVGNRRSYRRQPSKMAAKTKWQS